MPPRPYVRVIFFLRRLAAALTRPISTLLYTSLDTFSPPSSCAILRRFSIRAVLLYCKSSPMSADDFQVRDFCQILRTWSWHSIRKNAFSGSGAQLSNGSTQCRPAAATVSVVDSFSHNLQPTLLTSDQTRPQCRRVGCVRTHFRVRAVENSLRRARNRLVPAANVQVSTCASAIYSALRIYLIQ